MKHHGRNQAADNRKRYLCYLAGLGFVIAGYLRWPAELRSQVDDSVWNALLGLMPW